MANVASTNVMRVSTETGLVLIFGFFSSLTVKVESRLPVTMRAFVRNPSRPIASHAHFDLRAITAGRARGLDVCAFVHLHAGHVHVEVKFDIAHVDRLPAGIAKFD